MLMFSGTTVFEVTIFRLSCQVEQFTEEFLLHWKHVNNHQVANQTEVMTNQVMHIHFKPLTTLAPGFVVKFILTRYVVIVSSLLLNPMTNN